ASLRFVPRDSRNSPARSRSRFLESIDAPHEDDGTHEIPGKSHESSSISGRTSASREHSCSSSESLAFRAARTNPHDRCSADSDRCSEVPRRRLERATALASYGAATHAAHLRMKDFDEKFNGVVACLHWNSSLDCSAPDRSVTNATSELNSYTTN